MKRMLTCLLIMWLNLHLAGAPPVPSAYMKMSAEEAEAFLSGPYGGPVEQRAFVTEALAENNQALIQICLKNLDTRYGLLEAIEAMEEVSRRESLLLVMLRTDAGWWPPPNYIAFGSQFPTPLEGTLGQMIRKYFPNLELENGLVHTLEARTKLAADLEQAMNKTGHPALNSSESERVSKTNALSGSGESTVVAMPNPAEHKTPATPNQWLLWTLAILFALGIVTFLIKRKTA